MVDGPYNAGSANIQVNPSLAPNWKSRLKTQVEGRRVEGTVFMNPELVKGFASKAVADAKTALAGKNVSVKVGANLTGFIGELNTKLRPLDNKSHVKVKATPNMTGFVKDLNENLRPLDNKSHIKVQVEANLAGLGQRVRADLKMVNLPKIKLRVEPDFTGFATKLNAVQGIAKGKALKLPAHLDFTIAKAQLAAFKASAGNITLNVDLDTTGATSQLSSLMAQAVALRALLHGIPVGTSGGLGGGGGAGGMGGMGGALSMATMLKASLAAVGAVNLVPLVGQIAQVGNALALLPAAATAAGAALAAIMIGSTGVLKAFKAGSALTENDAKEAEQAAKAQASAQKQLQSAVESASDTQVQGARQVASAERGVESAQKSAVNAQKDLTSARKDAVDQIDDLNRALKGSVLDEREAELAVRRAKERIAEVGKSGNSRLDRDEARVGYQRAIQNLEDVRHRNQELAAEAQEANRKGVEGADIVVAAKERVAEADQGAVDAQRDLTEAQADAAKANARAAQQVADAQASVNEALSAGGDSADKYAKALENLTPGARGFVEQVRGLGDRWKALREATQESLFDGMGDSIVALADTQLPTLKEGLSGIASVLNGGLKSALGVFSGDAAQKDFAHFLTNSKTATDSLAQAMKPLSQVFIDLTTVGSDFLPQIAKGLGDATQRFSEFVSKSRDNGDLAAFFQRGIDTLKTLGSIVGNVFGSISAIFKGSRDEGEGMLKSLDDATGKMKDYLKSTDGQTKIKDFFRSFRDMLDKITPILSGLGGFIINSVVPAFQTWGSLVTPIIGGIVALMEKFPGLTRDIVLGFMVFKTITTVITGVQTALGGLSFALGPMGVLALGIAAAVGVLATLAGSQRDAKRAAEEHEQAIKNLRNTLDADTGKVTQSTVDTIREKAETDGRLETADGFGLTPQRYLDAIIEPDPAAYNDVRQRLNNDIIGNLRTQKGPMAAFERDGISLEMVADALAGDKAALAKYREYESRPGNQYALRDLKHWMTNEGDFAGDSALDLLTSVNAERQHLGLSQEGWQRTNESTGGAVAVTPEIADYFRNLSVDDSGPLGIEIEPTMPNRNTAVVKGQLTPAQKDALDRNGFKPTRNLQDNSWSINLNSDEAFFALGPMIDRAAGAPPAPATRPAPAPSAPPPAPAPSAGPALRPSIPISDADFDAMPRTMQNLYAEQTPGPTRGDLQGLLDPTGRATNAATTSDPQGRAFPTIGLPSTPAALDPLLGQEPAPAAESSGPDYSQAIASWNSYAGAVKAGFDDKVRPSLDGILSGTEQIRKAFTEGLQGVAAASWSEFVTKVTGDQGALAIQVSFGILTESLYDLANHFTIALVQNAAQREVDLANSTSNMVSTIGQIHFFGLGLALDNLALKFSDTVTGIGESWDGLKGSVANPINWIIEKVLNTGLRDAWNSVRTVVPDLPEWTVTVPKIEGFSTGGIMSGYAPGVDDRVIAVGPGEAVMRPEFAAAMGHDYINSMNAAARTGGVAGVRKLSDQIAGYYSNGGIVDSMRDVVAERFPMMSLTSGLRFTDSGYHSKGMAADFSNVGAGANSSPELQEMAGWWAANWADKTLQLIHNPFGHNIMDGKFVGDGFAAYGAGTMGEHGDHLHLAIKEALDGRPANLPPLAGGMSFGAAAARLLQDKFDKPLADLRGQMPDFGASLFGQVPGKLFDAFTGAAGNQIRKLAGRFGSLDAGATPWDISAGVEQWHDNIVAALIREGWEPSERNIMLTKRQMQTESGGDPNIVQKVIDVNSGGNEAVGPMQVTPGTFASYRNPTLPNDRTNVDASLSAALRWYRYKWGDDLGTQWGKGQGYDQGGIADGLGFMPKWTLEPERVLSPQQTKAFETLVDVLKDPKFIEALTSSYRNINPWRPEDEELDLTTMSAPDWLPQIDPVLEAREAEMRWFETSNPQATFMNRAYDLASQQSGEVETWLRDNQRGIVESAIAGAAPSFIINGGIHTTDWDQAQRKMWRGIEHHTRRYSRKGGR
ncbi:hypothetical protein LCL87_17100 [Rhodococcus hoagii]|nr:hypothetical protein [Prescottella equi]